MIEKMVGGVGGGRVDVITGKGCSRHFLDFSASFRGIPSFSLEAFSPASYASTVSESPVKIFDSHGPFSGLVICVTGLSKETRKQVKEAAQRLGGQYSPHLHPHCTHLVVQSFHGRKLEHALKHGPKNGLFLVTIGWFVDSVKRNVRLDETVYRFNSAADNGTLNGDSKRFGQSIVAENSGVPVGLVKLSKQSNMIRAPGLQFPDLESKIQTVSSSLSGQSFYVDVDVPAELHSKVVGALSVEGASLLNQWFIGCNASHVVCEGPSARKYLGHVTNLVTPLWVLKSTKEKSLQRLLHLSADLARYTGAMLVSLLHDASKEEAKTATSSANVPNSLIKTSHEERIMTVNLAKEDVRKRRNRRMQTCQTPIHPITPGTLLDSICWSVSEPTSTACIYNESSSVENAIEDQTSRFFDVMEDGKEAVNSFVNLSRPPTESEKCEVILKSHILTIMFPVDRFSEMGLRSRTFFSSKGFTCLQLLDHVYEFYQENMSAEEIEIAIHTDSRHADRLRAAYSSKEASEHGYVDFKRIDFLGSRKSFEMLKRVQGENNSNVYELLIRA